MSYTQILYQQSAGISIITLNRPQRLNAMSLTMIRELDKVLDEIMADDEVRVVIFTGSPRPDGRPCFCVGADMKEVAQQRQPTQILEANALLNRIEELAKPTIGAIDGICTAGGLELALVLDILIAADTAQISDLHMKNLGRLGGWGVQVRLPRAVGAAKAKEILWMGIPIDGNEAYRLGLVNKVFPPQELISRAKELAGVIAGMWPAALEWSKKSVNAAGDMPTHQALHYDWFCQQKAASGLSGEGLRAFIEGRPPQYKD